jgi:hypothetical protein
MLRGKGNFHRRDIKIGYSIGIFVSGNIAHNSCEAIEDHHPPDTSFLLLGGFFPPPTKTKKCHSSFGYVFTEDFRGPLTLVERACLNDGQHLNNFSVSHN